MAIKDLNNLSKNLLKRVRSTSSNLQGPIFTEYEFGLSPTLSFWSEKGRVHFYYFEQNRADYLIAEVAYLDPTLESRQTLIETRDEAWRILAQFLQQDYPITEVSEYSWLEIDTRRDWFIPRPPSDVEQKNSLSILVDLTAQHYLFLILWEWLGGISQIGGRPAYTGNQSFACISK